MLGLKCFAAIVSGVFAVQEQVVVTATGYPSDGDDGIIIGFNKNNLTLIGVDSEKWGATNTDLGRYIGWRFAKVNNISVTDLASCIAALKNVSPRDTVTFTLEKHDAERFSLHNLPRDVPCPWYPLVSDYNASKKHHAYKRAWGDKTWKVPARACEYLNDVKTKLFTALEWTNYPQQHVDNPLWDCLRWCQADTMTELLQNEKFLDEYVNSCRLPGICSWRCENSGKGFLVDPGSRDPTKTIHTYKCPVDVRERVNVLRRYAGSVRVSRFRVLASSGVASPCPGIQERSSVTIKRGAFRGLRGSVLRRHEQLPERWLVTIDKDQVFDYQAHELLKAQGFQIGVVYAADLKLTSV
eukprot:gene1003-242_t